MVTDKEYHASNALGSTDIRCFACSSRDFVAYRKEKAAPSDAMKLGTAFHAAFLTPQLFDPSSVSKGNLLRIQNAVQQADKCCLPPRSYWKAEQNLFATVRCHPDIKVYPTVKDNNFKHTRGCKLLSLKAKPDILIETEQLNVIIDIKTTARVDCLDRYAVQRYLHKYDVGMQLAHYSKVIPKFLEKNCKAFVLCVSMSPPHHCCLLLFQFNMQKYNYVRWEQAIHRAHLFFSKGEHSGGIADTVFLPSNQSVTRGDGQEWFAWNKPLEQSELV